MKWVLGLGADCGFLELPFSKPYCDMKQEPGDELVGYLQHLNAAAMPAGLVGSISFMYTVLNTPSKVLFLQGLFFFLLANQSALEKSSTFHVTTVKQSPPLMIGELESHQMRIKSYQGKNFLLEAPRPSTSGIL